ncbi:MAG: hypothetical protein IKA32_06485 [Lentisphaeria bacterium]|nr:hypothetical protein [Lentisphaeria bacterium]
MFKTLFDRLAALYSPEKFRENTLKIYELEKSVCSCDFERSTAFIVSLLKEAGFSDVRRISHPADGVTSAADSIMPEAWEFTKRSTLEVISDWPEEERIIADTAEIAIAAVPGCGPTPPGGATGELVMYDPEHPENAAGKWVFYNGTPRGKVYFPLARAGALGIVSTNLEMGKYNPDATCWMNGVGHFGWYRLKDEPQLPMFSITARRANALLARLEAGEKVVLHGEMYARNYNGNIYTVTGVIPGDSEEEFALVSHMYEPFPADDASGVAAAVEIGRILKESGIKLKKSLRVVFSMEYYGTMAFFLSKEHHIKLALNTDGVAPMTYKQLGYPLEWRTSSVALPSFSDLLMLRVFECCAPDMRIAVKTGTLSDDTFGGEPSIGIPTNWLWADVDPFHHFSDPVFNDVDWKLGNRLIPLISVYAAVLLGSTFEQWQKLLPELKRIAVLPLAFAGDVPAVRKVKCDFAASQLRSLENWVPGLESGAEKAVAYFRKPLKEIPPENPAEEEAAKLYFKRLSPGMPWSLVRVPYPEKRVLNINHTQYALLDGTRSLLETIRIAHNAGMMAKLSEQGLKRLISDLYYLEKYGYLSSFRKEA